MRTYPLILSCSLLIMFSCGDSAAGTSEADHPGMVSTRPVPDTTQRKHLRPFDQNLPTVGILMYDGVLTTEVTAPADVFSKPDGEGGASLFNVVTVAQSTAPIVTEDNLTLVPEYTFDNCPKLTVLFVPSAYDMYSQVHNTAIVDFIKSKNEETQYTVSNCGGAQLIGASGIASGKKIVTWIRGGEQLQKDYPDLLVQDDATITFVRDGKFFSSNGNLASYVSSLELVEAMTNRSHREFVESYIYLDRIKNWTFGSPAQ